MLQRESQLHSPVKQPFETSLVEPMSPQRIQNVGNLVLVNQIGGPTVNLLQDFDQVRIFSMREEKLRVS